MPSEKILQESQLLLIKALKDNDRYFNYETMQPPEYLKEISSEYTQQLATTLDVEALLEDRYAHIKQQQGWVTTTFTTTTSTTKTKTITTS